MPYDVKNFLKMANMFGQERDLNPTLIPPELNPNPPLPSNPMGDMGMLPQTPPMEAPAPPMGGFGQPEAPQGQPLPDFSPITRSSDRAYQMLDQMPKPSAPGVGRKIGASLVGLGLGPQYAERALYGPYHTQLDQWKEEFAPTIQAANQERYYNANMRQLADSMMRDKVAQQRADIAQQRADIALLNVQNRAENERKKREIEEWKFNNRDGKVEILKNGNIGLIRGTEVIDTGWASNDIDPITLQNLRGQQAMERVKESGQQQINLENLRQGKFGPPIQIFTGGQPTTPYQFNPRGEARPVQGLPEGGYLRELPPGSSAGDTLPLETPRNQKERWQVNAAYYLQKHPEDEGFIEFDPTNPDAFPIVKPVGTEIDKSWMPWSLGAEGSVLTAEKKADIERAIFGVGERLPTRTIRGDGGPNATIQAPGKTPPPNTPIQGQPKVGDIRVAPNGLKLRFDGTGWVKAPGQ